VCIQFKSQWLSKVFTIVKVLSFPLVEGTVSDPLYDRLAIPHFTSCLFSDELKFEYMGFAST
jgi:hypothetical protein